MIPSFPRLYRRWRHTRGFGVHSPFAFSLIERVVRPGRVAYYGYGEIDHELDVSGVAAGRDKRRLRREARFLLRLLVTLRPSALILPRNIHPAFLRAAKASGVSMRKSTGGGDLPFSPDRGLLLIDGESMGEYDTNDLDRFLSEPYAAILFLDLADQRPVRDLFGRMSNGLYFDGKDSALLVNRRGMHKVTYTIHLF